MSETLAQPDHFLSEQQLHESNAHYLEAMAGFSADIPEIGARQEELAEAGEALIGQFAIEPTLFDDPSRSLVFATIANRWHDNQNQTGEASQKEHDFLLDSLTLLAYNHSPQLRVFKSDIEHQTGLSDEQEAKVYDRYTQHQLTAEIKEAIAGGILDGVKHRLKITEENEDPYEVRVLIIDPNGQTAYGLIAPKLPSYEDLPGETGAEKMRVLDSYGATRADATKWQKGLEARTTQMAHELNRDDAFGAAWVTTIDGKSTLCIAQATAEKILNPELTDNAEWYGESDLARDKAILEHEYTHTQGGHNLDNEITFGINVEEFRAEHFAGNKMGYMEIKGFFQDLRTITGDLLTAFMDSKPKGGSMTESYGHFINQLGLNTTLELLLAAPQNYIAEQSNSFHRAAYGHIGGFDGVLGRILERRIADGQGAPIEERLQERAQRWIDIVPDAPSSVAGQRKRVYGLNVISDLIVAHVEKLQAEASPISH